MRHIIGDVQNPEPPAIGHLVMHEVERPAGVGLCRDGDRRAQARGSPPGLAFANPKAFLPVQPVDAVDAGWLPLPPQHDEQAAVAEPPPFIGKLPQSRPQFRLRRPP